MKNEKIKVRVIIAVLSAITAASVALAVYTAKSAESSRHDMEINYSHAFSEIVSGIEGLDAALEKSVVVTSPSMACAVCTEIYAKAQTTSMALGVLPFSASELEKTIGFVNAAGDYAFAIAQKSSRGEAFTHEEREGLRSLSNTASALYKTLKGIENEIGGKTPGLEQYRRTMKELGKRGDELISQTLADTMSIVNERFPQLPQLVYDGPFSEHLKSDTPKYLEDREEIDESQGRRSAASFIGMRPEQVYVEGEINGRLPSLRYGAQQSGAQVSICVSKVGGVVISSLNSRVVDTSVLTENEALDAAKKMLERWGYADMKETHHIVRDNILTVYFAYEQEGIIYYPDSIHVGIAMDNGMLQCFDATGYIFSHTRHEPPQAQVSMESARERIPEGLKILSEERAVISSPGKYELLCYEFKCEQPDGKRFIIYVNALTGSQEKILTKKEDENGPVIAA